MYKSQKNKKNIKKTIDKLGKRGYNIDTVRDRT